MQRAQARVGTRSHEQCYKKCVATILKDKNYLEKRIPSVDRHLSGSRRPGPRLSISSRTADPQFQGGRARRWPSPFNLSRALAEPDVSAIWVSPHAPNRYFPPCDRRHGQPDTPHHAGHYAVARALVSRAGMDHLGPRVRVGRHPGGRTQVFSARGWRSRPGRLGSMHRARHGRSGTKAARHGSPHRPRRTRAFKLPEPVRSFPRVATPRCARSSRSRKAAASC